MSRDITAAYKTEIKTENIEYVLFVELLFDGENAVRVTSAPFDIDWDGLSWVGVGHLGEVSPVEEKSDMTATKYEVSLSGVPSEMISLCFLPHKGKKATIWLGLRHGIFNAFTLIASPALIFSGTIDTMVISIGSSSKVVVTLASDIEDWDKARTVLYTNVDQQALFPGDQGLELIELMEEFEVVWGRS